MLSLMVKKEERETKGKERKDAGGLVMYLLFHWEKANYLFCFLSCVFGAAIFPSSGGIRRQFLDHLAFELIRVPWFRRHLRDALCRVFSLKPRGSGLGYM